MTAAELVRHTQEHILRDVATPKLWRSVELLAYLNEAEALFARRTHALTDETSPLSLLSVIAGKSTYALDRRIIHVYEVMDENGRPLRTRSRAQLPRSFANSKPHAFTTGRGSKSLRLAPTPAEDAEYTMLVARKPLKPLKHESDTPEIDEDYHMHLCTYAAYKSLINNDPEGSNTVAAGDYLAQWEQAVREAKRDVFRERVPSQARVVNNWTAAGRI